MSVEQIQDSPAVDTIKKRGQRLSFLFYMLQRFYRRASMPNLRTALDVIVYGSNTPFPLKFIIGILYRSASSIYALFIVVISFV